MMKFCSQTFYMNKINIILKIYAHPILVYGIFLITMDDSWLLLVFLNTKFMHEHECTYIKFLLQQIILYNLKFVLSHLSLIINVCIHSDNKAGP